MKISDEQLMAYVDGELPAADVEQIEAAMALDPVVAAMVARHRGLRGRLRDAFAPALDEPVPGHLLAMLREPAQTAANVVPLVPRHVASQPRRWALPEWAAIAASLVLGIALSQWLAAPASPLLLSSSEGGLVAGRSLSRQLERQLSADAGEGGVAVGLTFRNVDGGYCRSFTVGPPQSLAGLACRRKDESWQVPVVMEAAPAAGGELQQASSALPPALLSELDARIAGQPLDATQELAARDAGWR